MYRLCFQEAVDKRYAELLVQNIEASQQKCQKILTDLYGEVNEGVQNGKYAKPGGYKLYCAHRESVIAQYRSQLDKGIQVRNTDLNHRPFLRGCS